MDKDFQAQIGNIYDAEPLQTKIDSSLLGCYGSAQ